MSPVDMPFKGHNIVYLIIPLLFDTYSLFFFNLFVFCYSENTIGCMFAQKPLNLTSISSWDKFQAVEIMNHVHCAIKIWVKDRKR
jgi:hypothetical protein